MQIPELTKDLVCLCAILTTCSSISRFYKDITLGVQLDPRHTYPVACGVAGEVYRGLYTCIDYNTQQLHTTQVSIAFINNTVDSCKFSPDCSQATGRLGTGAAEVK
jgi:hypothetical protein